MMKWRSGAALLGGGLFVIVGAATAEVVLSPQVSYIRTHGGASQVQPHEPVVEHILTPTPVRAVYMTQCVVGTPSFRANLVDLIDKTELNAVVIDIKDYSGGIGFPTDNPMLAPYVSKKCGAADMRSFIRTLHEKGIYVIGRITVFQDPTYAKAHPEQAVQKVGGGIWHNFGGLAFVDVGAKPFWDYIVELSKVAYREEGFDELNYDYIRFPSDGPMKEAVYALDTGISKEEALENFFKYLHDNVRPVGVVMSADLFGYVTIHTDDLGIGQILERTFAYFDFIDPMVYPSHYNSGFAGLKDVNSDPYKVVHISLLSAVARAEATTTPNYAFGETAIASTSPQLYEKPSYPASKIRPWLQAFDYPVTYTPAMVEAQVKATNDAGLESYLMWDAGNKYRSLKEVLASYASATSAGQ
jgi:hypothetical protein